MTFDLNQLAEGRFLNKRLLEFFVYHKTETGQHKYFWREDQYGDYLSQHFTNTWESDKLVEEFKKFCEPKNILKTILQERTFIRGIELEFYMDKFDSAIDEIIDIYKLENISREVPKIK